MKRKLFSFVLTLSLSLSLVTVVGAAEPTMGEEKVLEIECMDFYENQDYYMSLVEEKDYTLHFDVTNENRDFVLAKMAEGASDTAELQPAVTRGLTAPTQGHNINTGSLTFNGDAEYSNLYTNKYCTGSDCYVVTLLNDTYEAAELKVTAYNVLRPYQITYFPAGVTVKKYIMSGTTYASAIKQHFYLQFHAPVHASGTIAKG